MLVRKGGFVLPIPLSHEICQFFFPVLKGLGHGEVDATLNPPKQVAELTFNKTFNNRATGALFMQVSLDECVLHLSEHSGDASTGAAVKLHTDRIEEYVAQLIAKKFPPGVAEQDPGSLNSPGVLSIWCWLTRLEAPALYQRKCPGPRGSSPYSQ